MAAGLESDPRGIGKVLRGIDKLPGLRKTAHRDLLKFARNTSRGRLEGEELPIRSNVAIKTTSGHVKQMVRARERPQSDRNLAKFVAFELTWVRFQNDGVSEAPTLLQLLFPEAA